MYEPWIGSEYDTTRLLLLGESTYSWWEGDEQHHPSFSHSCESVEWAIENFPDCGRFFCMVSRGLAGEEKPTKERLQAVWNRVAFTNYVSASVGAGARTRPIAKMWDAARRDFLGDLGKFMPRRIIVLGRTMWANMPDTHLYLSEDIQGYNIGNKMILVQATCHPAGGLSWRHLAGLIHFTYSRELAT